MRSAAHHKPMTNPVPQMIGVPSQPKRGPSSPTIHAAHSAAVSVRQHPEPTGECSPKCGQAQGAHDHAAGPNPKVVGCVPPNGLDQQHDGADHRQPHARAEGAEKPCGQQCPQAAHGILDVFPFIGGGHEFRGCVGHVVGQQRNAQKMAANRSPGPTSGIRAVLSWLNRSTVNNDSPFWDEDFFFRGMTSISAEPAVWPQIEALARTFASGVQSARSFGLG